MQPQSNLIHADEALDDLQNGLFIIQKEKCFKFGVDAVLLADFARGMRGSRCIDLCTGSGIVPLLLSQKTNISRIDGMEIQSDVADTAKRSVLYNKLSERIFIECGDLKNAVSVYGKRVFDAVTCNPPYMKSGAALQNDADNKIISRHEVMCTLDDIIRVSSELLKVGGHMYMVHRPSRLADVICTMRAHKIEPKRLRLVHPTYEKPPKLILIEGIFCGGAELRCESPLFIFDGDGNETDEVRRIYNRNSETEVKG